MDGVYTTDLREIQQNGTYLRNEELLFGQRGATSALIINKTLQERSKVEGHRLEAIRFFGRGLRCNTVA